MQVYELCKIESWVQYKVRGDLLCMYRLFLKHISNSASAPHTPLACWNWLGKNKTLSQQTSFDGHFIPVPSKKTQTESSAYASVANALVHPHMKFNLWNKLKKAFNHFRFRNRASTWGPSQLELKSSGYRNVCILKMSTGPRRMPAWPGSGRIIGLARLGSGRTIS